jgi:hypothetical protein
MWLEKYLSMILVVITRAKRILLAISSLSFPSPSSFFKTEKLRFLFVRTNAWIQLKADGNLGFLTQSESLTSEHDVSTLLCVCVYVVVGRTRRKNAFKSRTSLKSCRRPTEKRTFTEMQCPIKRDWISVAAAAIYLRVGWRQRRSSSGEWGAEGSRNWGLSVSRFLSLALFLIWKKKSWHACVCVSARSHVQWNFSTNHNHSSSMRWAYLRVRVRVECLLVLFLVEHCGNKEKKRKKKGKWLGRWNMCLKRTK